MSPFRSQPEQQRLMRARGGTGHLVPAPVTPRRTILDRLADGARAMAEGMSKMVASIELFGDSISVFHSLERDKPRGIKPPIVPGPTVPKPADQWRQVISTPHQNPPRVARRPAGMKRPGGMPQ